MQNYPAGNALTQLAQFDLPNWEKTTLAARLTVVVTQTANRSPSITDLEETLVTELIMTPGMDATMVGPLERIQPEDTDFLCISSFNYSFVLLSWLDTEIVAAQWQRLGLGGDVVALENEESVSGSDATKKILHWKMTESSHVAKIVAELKQLLNARQTKVVPLSISPVVTTAKSKDSAEQPTSSALRATGNNSEAVEDSSQASRPVQHLAEADSEATVSESQAQSLNQLVDDFDALDL